MRECMRESGALQRSMFFRKSLLYLEDRVSHCCDRGPSEELPPFQASFAEEGPNSSRESTLQEVQGHNQHAAGLILGKSERSMTQGFT